MYSVKNLCLRMLRNCHDGKYGRKIWRDPDDLASMFLRYSSPFSPESKNLVEEDPPLED